jgi:hypothetical protein
MRVLNPKLEPFGTAHVLAGRNAAGFEIARLAEVQRRSRKHKNRGNEAKKWLKTKGITFLNDANYAQICTNRTLKGAKAAHFAQNEAKTLKSRGEAEK